MFEDRDGRCVVGFAARQHRDGRGADEGKADQHGEARHVAARDVVQSTDEHRRGRFGDTVSGENDPHGAAQHARAEQLRRHQRDHHVLAPEPDAEHDREQGHRALRARIDQDGNGSRDEQIDQQHHALLRPAIGEPSHRESSDEARRERQRRDACGRGLRVAVIEAEIQLEMLIGAADRGDRAHAADRQQIEGRAPEHVIDRRERGTIRVRCGVGRSRWRLLHDERERERDDDDHQTERLERRVPSERLGELERDEGHERATKTDAEVGESHRASTRRVEPARE